MSDGTSSPQPTPSRVLLGRAIGRIWWLILLRGIILVVLGLYALLAPGLTLEAFVQVLAIFAIVDGVLALISGVQGWDETQHWTLARGAISLVIGILVLINAALVSAIAATVVVVIFAIHVIAVGALEIAVATHERKQMQGEGWLIFSGVLSIIFGVLLLAAPIWSMLLLIRVIGVFVMLFGAVLVSNALRARSVGRSLSSGE